MRGTLIPVRCKRWLDFAADNGECDQVFTVLFCSSAKIMKKSISAPTTNTLKNDSLTPPATAATPLLSGWLDAILFQRLVRINDITG